MEESQTKLAFSQALEQLMKQKTVEKIRIHDLVELSGRSRQTFYRHFHDIYDLIDWTHWQKTMHLSLDLYGAKKDLKECLALSMRLMLQNKDFYQKLLSIDGHNSFYSGYYARARENLLQFAKEKKQLSTLDESLLFSVRFFAAGMAQGIVEWIRNGMQESPEDLAQRFIDTMPSQMKHLFQTV